MSCDSLWVLFDKHYRLFLGLQRPSVFIVCYCPWLCPLHLGNEICSAQMLASTASFYLDTVTLSLYSHTNDAIGSWEMCICEMEVMELESAPPIKHYENLLKTQAAGIIGRHSQKLSCPRTVTLVGWAFLIQLAATSVILNRWWTLDKNQPKNSFLSSGRSLYHPPQGCFWTRDRMAVTFSGKPFLPRAEELVAVFIHRETQIAAWCSGSMREFAEKLLCLWRFLKIIYIHTACE